MSEKYFSACKRASAASALRQAAIFLKNVHRTFLKISHPQLGNGDLLIDALDRLGEHGSDGQVLDLLALVGGDGGDGIQECQLGDDAVVDALDSGTGEDTVGSAGVDVLCAADLDQSLGSVAQGACGVDHVVKQDAVLTLNIADDVHDLALVGLLAALVNDSQIHVQLLSEGAGAGDRADIRRNNDHVLALFAELLGVVVNEDGVAVEVIHGDVKEALDLGSVQVHGQHTVSAGGGDHVGDQLGGDGIAGLGLAVLTGIAEVGHDGGDAAGGGALHSVDHDQHFHQIVVDGGAGGLDQEDVGAADGLVDGDRLLTVGEGAHLGRAQGSLQLPANSLGQGAVGIAGEDLDILSVCDHRFVPLFSFCLL